MSEPVLKPPALRGGDKVGILAPASSFSRQGFDAGCERLRTLGYIPIYSPDIFDRDLYFAGSAERRTHELEEFLIRDDIRGLVCVRGGYGSNYLLEKIHFDLFQRHPKILLGCSDITSLLTAIHDRTGLVTFHGPMLAKDIADNAFNILSFKQALQGSTDWQLPTDGMLVLRRGQAMGKLYGGCLSMLVASLGTPFEIQTHGTILFIEDVGEKPFRIDRMLMQLHLAGKLKGVRGFVFGEMLDCLPPPGESYTLPGVIQRVLAPYNVPIVYGLKSGHVSGGNCTVPLGVQAALVAADEGVELTILEAATEIR